MLESIRYVRQNTFPTLDRRPDFPLVESGQHLGVAREIVRRLEKLHKHEHS